MGLSVGIAQKQIRSTDGVDSLTDTNVGQITPVFCMAGIGDASSLNTENADFNFSVGAAISPTNRSGIRIRNNSRSVFTDGVVERASSSDVVDFNSFKTNGADFDVTNAGGFNKRFGGWFLGGTSVTDIARAVVTPSSTVGGTTTVDFGFQPDLLIVLGVGTSVPDSSASFSVYHVGFVTWSPGGGGAATTRAVLCNLHSTNGSDQIVDTTHCAGQLSDGVVDWRAEVTARGSTDVTFTTRDGDPGGDQFVVFALEFDSEVGVEVFDFDTPTSTGVNAHSVTSNTPITFMLVSTMADTLDQVDSDVPESGSFGFSWVHDGSTEIAFGYREGQGAETGDGSWFDTKAIELPYHDGTMGTGAAAGNGIRATLDSMSSSGFSLNYTTTNTTARKTIGFALTDLTSEVTFTTNSLDQTQALDSTTIDVAGVSVTLSPDDLAQTQTLDSPALGGLGRSLTTSMLNAVTGTSLSPILIAKFEFEGGDTNLWSGIGDLTFDGDTYTGVGDLLGVNSAEETSDIRAVGLRFSLSGIPSSLISLALNEDYQERPATLWLGALDDSGALISEPVLVFRGRMDVMEITDRGESAEISMTTESRLIDINRPNESRYTSEDQHIDFPNDMGFEFVATLQDKELQWGQLTPREAVTPAPPRFVPAGTAPGGTGRRADRVPLFKDTKTGEVGIPVRGGRPSSPIIGVRPIGSDSPRR